MTELSPAGGVPFGRLVAALSGDGADLPSLTRVLTTTLADALPTGMVEVEWHRSMSDRLASRDGTPVGLSVTVGDKILTLNQGRGGRNEAVVAHVVRNVVITRSPVSIPAWISALATELTKLAEADDAARGALNRLLLD